VNWVEYWQFANYKRNEFLSAEPFPNIVFDNFLPAEIAEVALQECPAPDSPVWKRSDNSYTHAKATISYKDGLKDFYLSDTANQILQMLNSGPFMRLVTLLSGVELVPDPYYIEGAYHILGNGGKLGVHADFSHHPVTGLERRLNLLWYLNKDWKPEYGGNLGLFDKELNRKVDVAPLFNRAVFFMTSDTSFHGHPEPMNLPEGVWRRSIAMYYYSIPTDRAQSKIKFALKR
jgi:Rps23 Pro-64 3,4-dihydroxylase Tpa1-like proline 4-hydroxylase